MTGIGQSQGLIMSAKKKSLSGPKRPFRFFDHRQKYLAFVNTCNEKWKVAERAAKELTHLRPKPPALRIFDAGMGDGTVLTHLMRAMHQRFSTLPFYIVGKEVSLEDIRLSLEKLPDRLIEHPASVIVLTNLYYAEAPWLMPRNPKNKAALNWKTVELEGDTAYGYGQQLRDLDEFLVDAWETTASTKTGNPLYVRPTVLLIHRKDHEFSLDSVIPRPDQARADYDFVLASQPWRARMDAQFKVKYVMTPLTHALRPGGRLLAVQSYGNDVGLEMIQRVWPDENPFQVGRHELVKTLEEALGYEASEFEFDALTDDDSIFRYHMHTLPEGIAESIGTSTLFAAWNAATYVAQIEDQRLERVLSSAEYVETTAAVLQEHGGLWFNDESFVVSRYDN